MAVAIPWVDRCGGTVHTDPLFVHGSVEHRPSPKDVDTTGTVPTDGGRFNSTPVCLWAANLFLLDRARRVPLSSAAGHFADAPPRVAAAVNASITPGLGGPTAEQLAALIGAQANATALPYSEGGALFGARLDAAAGGGGGAESSGSVVTSGDVMLGAQGSLCAPWAHRREDPFSHPDSSSWHGVVGARPGGWIRTDDPLAAGVPLENVVCDVDPFGPGVCVGAWPLDQRPWHAHLPGQPTTVPTARCGGAVVADRGSHVHCSAPARSANATGSVRQYLQWAWSGETPPGGGPATCGDDVTVRDPSRLGFTLAGSTVDVRGVTVSAGNATAGTGNLTARISRATGDQAGDPADAAVVLMTEPPPPSSSASDLEETSIVLEGGLDLPAGAVVNVGTHPSANATRNVSHTIDGFASHTGQILLNGVPIESTTAAGRYALVASTRMSGTSGGNAIAGQWTTVPINKVLTDEFGVVTKLRANDGAFLVGPGRYTLEVRAPLKQSQDSSLRVVNADSGLTVVLGVSTAAISASFAAAGTFDLPSSAHLRLERGQSGADADGLGQPVGSGEDEVYAVIEISRVGDSASADPAAATAATAAVDPATAAEDGLAYAVARAKFAKGATPQATSVGWASVLLNVLTHRHGPRSRITVAGSGDGVVLAAGHYHVYASLAMIKCADSRLRLWDVTRGEVLAYGMTGDSAHASVTGALTLVAVVSLEAETEVRVEVYATVASLYLGYHADAANDFELFALAEFSEVAQPEDTPPEFRAERAVLRAYSEPFSASSGASTAPVDTWGIRELPHLVQDPDGIVLSHDPARGTFTLGPGTYHVHAKCHGYHNLGTAGMNCRVSPADAGSIALDPGADDAGDEGGSGGNIAEMIVLGTDLRPYYSTVYGIVRGRIRLTAPSTEMALMHADATTPHASATGAGSGGPHRAVTSEVTIARIDTHIAAGIANPLTRRIPHARFEDVPRSGLPGPPFTAGWNPRPLRSVARNVLGIADGASDPSATPLPSNATAWRAGPVFTSRSPERGGGITLAPGGTYNLYLRTQFDHGSRGTCRITQSHESGVQTTGHAMFQDGFDASSVCEVWARIDVPYAAARGVTVRAETFADAPTTAPQGPNGPASTSPDVYASLDVWKIGPSVFSSPFDPDRLAEVNPATAWRTSALLLEPSLAPGAEGPKGTAGWRRRRLAARPDAASLGARAWALGMGSVTGVGDRIRPDAASGGVTLSPGCYEVLASAPVFNPLGERVRLVDAGTTAVVAHSMSGGSTGNGAYGSSMPEIVARVTVAPGADRTLALEAYAANTNAAGSVHGKGMPSGALGTESLASMYVTECPRDAAAERSRRRVAVSALLPGDASVAGDGAAGYFSRVAYNSVDEVLDPAAGTSPAAPGEKIFLGWDTSTFAGVGAFIVSRGAYDIAVEIAVSQTDSTACTVSDPSGTRTYLVTTAFHVESNPVTAQSLRMRGTIFLPDPRTTLVVSCLLERSTQAWFSSFHDDVPLTTTKVTVSTLTLERRLEFETPRETLTAAAAANLPIAASWISASPTSADVQATLESLAGDAAMPTQVAEFVQRETTGTASGTGPASTDQWTTVPFNEARLATDQGSLASASAGTVGACGPVLDPAGTNNDWYNANAAGSPQIAYDIFDPVRTCMPNGANLDTFSGSIVTQHPSGHGVLIAPGSYRVSFAVNGYKSTAHLARLYDVARGVTVLAGTNAVSGNHAATVSTTSTRLALLHVDTESHLALEVDASGSSGGTAAAGVASSDTLDEVYSMLRFERVKGINMSVDALADGQQVDALSYGVAVAMEFEPVAAAKACTADGAWDPVPLRSIAFRYGRKIAIDQATGRLVLREGLFDLRAFMTSYRTGGSRIRLRDVTPVGPGNGTIADGTTELYSNSGYGRTGGASAAMMIREPHVNVTGGVVHLQLEVFCESSASGEWGANVADLAMKDIWATVEVAEVGATFTDQLVATMPTAAGTDAASIANEWNPLELSDIMGGEGGSLLGYIAAPVRGLDLAPGTYRIGGGVMTFRMGRARARIVSVDRTTGEVQETLVSSVSAIVQSTGDSILFPFSARLVLPHGAVIRAEVYVSVASARGIYYAINDGYKEQTVGLEIWREDDDETSSSTTSTTTATAATPLPSRFRPGRPERYEETQPSGTHGGQHKSAWERRSLSVCARTQAHQPTSNVTSATARGGIALGEADTYRIEATPVSRRIRSFRTRIWSDTHFGDAAPACAVARSDDVDSNAVLSQCITRVDATMPGEEIALGTSATIAAANGRGRASTAPTVDEIYATLEATHLRDHWRGVSAIHSNGTVVNGSIADPPPTERDGSCLFRYVSPTGDDVGAAAANSWETRVFNQLGVCASGFAIDPAPTASSGNGGDAFIPDGVYEITVGTTQFDAGSMQMRLQAASAIAVPVFASVAYGLSRVDNTASAHRNYLLYTLNTTQVRLDNGDAAEGGVLLRVQQVQSTVRADAFGRAVPNVPSMEQWHLFLEAVPRTAAYEDHFVLQQRAPRAQNGGVLAPGFKTRKLTHIWPDDTGVRLALFDNTTDPAPSTERARRLAHSSGSLDATSGSFTLARGVYRFLGFVNHYEGEDSVSMITEVASGRNVAFSTTVDVDAGSTSSSSAALVGTLIVPHDGTEYTIRTYVEINEPNGEGVFTYSEMEEVYAMIEFWKVAGPNVPAGAETLRALGSARVVSSYASNTIPTTTDATTKVYNLVPMTASVDDGEGKVVATLHADGSFSLSPPGLYRAEVHVATAHADRAQTRLISHNRNIAVLPGMSVTDGATTTRGAVPHILGVFPVHSVNETFAVMVSASITNLPLGKNANLLALDEIAAFARFTLLGLGDGATTSEATPPALMAGHDARVRQMPGAFLAEIVDATVSGAGGNLPADTWQARELNELVYDRHGTAPEMPATGTAGEFVLRRGLWIVRVVAMTWDGGMTRLRLRGVTRAAVVAHSVSTYVDYSGVLYLTTTVDITASEEVFVVEQRNDAGSKPPSDDSRGVDRAWHVVARAELLVPDQAAYPESPASHDADLALLRETKSSGVNAGVESPADGTWLRRLPNEVAYDAAGIAAVDAATGEITLPAGRYRFRSVGVGYKCVGSTSRLLDLTGARTLAVGVSNFDAAAQLQSSMGFMETSFTLAATSVVAVETYCYDDQNGGDMLGFPVGEAGVDEVYGLHEFWRVKDPVPSGAPTRQVAHVTEEWPSDHPNVALAFTPVDDYITRKLNVVRVNEGSIVSLDITSHVLTLAAGSYECVVVSACYDCADAHLRLFDIDANVPIAVGMPGYLPTYGQNNVLEYRFVLERETRIVVEHRVSGASPQYARTRDWGVPTIGVSATFTRFSTDDATGAPI